MTTTTTTTNNYLLWECINKLNTRAVSYAQRDFNRILEEAGCIVEPYQQSKMISRVKYPVHPNATYDELMQARAYVTDAFRLIHPKLVRTFKGIYNDETKVEYLALRRAHTN